MSSEHTHTDNEADSPRQDREEADGYERWLEIVGSLLLAFLGLVVVWRSGDGQFGLEVGADLFAAGIVGLLVFAVYGWIIHKRRQRIFGDQEALLNQILSTCIELENRTEIEEQKIQEAITAGVPESLAPFQVAREIGLVGFEAGRPSEINQNVLEAEETVDILEVSLNSMRHIDTDEWRGCKAKVRIILLDPLFPEDRPLAIQRDREEAKHPGLILKEIHDILETLPDEWLTTSSEGSDSSEEPSVKLAKVMPTLSYFRIDGVAYFAPLVHKQLGHETLHLQLTQGGEFFEALTDHFEKLWKDQHRVRPVAPKEIPSEYAGLSL